MNRFPHTRRIAYTILALAAAFAMLLGGCDPSQITTSPSVVGVSPREGATDVAPTTVIRVTFDQEMDAESVETAFSLSPAMPGTTSWDGNTFAFAPGGAGYQPGTTYQVTIAATARSKTFRNLERSVSFQFTVAGAPGVSTADQKTLQVTVVQPADETAEAAMDGDILVQFSRPMVPLTTLDALDDTPPFIVEPPVNGAGKWLNTAIYVLRPAEPLAPATRYRVTVPRDTASVDGSTLSADYTWTFTTVLPAVVAVYPRENSRFVGPSDTITVTFNQPMDRPSVQEHFGLSAGTQDVAGRFAWRDDQTMTFHPTEDLPLDTACTGRLGIGALGAGGAPLRQEHTWSFHTVGMPTVTDLEPTPGADIRYHDNVRVKFSNPMDRASAAASLTIAPTVTHVYSYWYSSNTEWNISPDFAPSTHYIVTFGHGAQDRYGLPLDQEYTVSFTTRALDPWTYLYKTGTQVFFPADDPIAVYVGHRNVDELRFALYKMDAGTFLRTGEWFSDEWAKYTPADEDLLHAWPMAVTAPLNAAGTVSTTVTLADGARLTPGLYFLRVEGDDGQDQDQMTLVVSRHHLTLKRTETQALVWAGELATGDVSPGLQLSFYDAAGQPLGQAITDGDGVAMTPLPKDANPYGNIWVFAAEDSANASTSADFGVVSTGWNQGLEPWAFDVAYTPRGQQYRAFLYTERSIYRPGQTVYFRGVVRGDDDGAFSVPAGLEAQVTVYDGQRREILSETRPLNEFGAFDGQLELSDEASLGFYSILVRLEDPHDHGYWQTFSHGFSVAEYRKPEFAVTVETDRDEYIHGDTMNVAVDAQYYFGAPVAGGQVNWRVMTEPYHFTLPEDQVGGWYSFTDLDEEWGWEPPQPEKTEVVTEGTGKTDEQGKFVTKVQADISQKPISQRYTVEASVVDLNNQEVSNRTTAVVHKGLFYIGLRPERYVGTVDKPQTIHVLTVDPQGEPMPNEVVDVSYYTRKWYSVRQKDADGTFYWTWTHSDTLVMTDTVTTDTDGRTTAVYTPTVGGSYRIVAAGTDARDNTIRSAVFQWVTSREYVSWRMEDHDRVDLVADKREYQPGDVAEILVSSPYRDAQVLVSVERGKLISHRVLAQTSNSMVVTVPVTSDYVPNVYVSVVLLKRPTEDDPTPGFKVGYAELKVAADEKVLDVTVTPEQDTYGPRDKATYRLKAVNQEGLGVHAEFSLALVDKAVLDLVGDTTGSIVDAFYSNRLLGVQTAGSLVRGMEHANARGAKDTDAGKGGGGGEGGVGLVRRYFPDVAYWDAHVVTDRSGEAVVTVDLPDNLTTWQMRALGTTGPDTLVGDARSEIVTRKPLLVRPALPRFLVADDEARFLAIVHNYTTESLEVDVTLTASGVTVKDVLTQRVTVPADGAETVTWDVTVMTGQSAVSKEDQVTVKVAATATADAEPDAVELTLPVYRYSTPEVVATAGEVAKADTRTEIVQLPQGIDTSQGELTLRLDPSLAAGMRDGLRYLRDFPYMCVEQTVSRFLPNVITYRALKDLGIQNPDLEEALPGLVERALQRLYKFQNPDGGWGWWDGEKSQPWLTAYTLYGLHVAQEAGFTVDDAVTSQAADYLSTYLAKRTDAQAADDANTRAYVLYVLAETGQGDLGRTVALFDQRATLGHYSRAFLLMALEKQVGSDDPRVRTLVSDLTGAAIMSATGAHWEEESHHYWTMNTNNRSTSIALAALVRADPTNALIPNAVRWLMVSRQEGHWETTQETAFAVLALTDFMVATGELEGDYTYRVSLNGEQLSERTITKENVGEQEKLVVEVAQLLLGLDQRNELVMERLAPTTAQSGEGKLWYAAHLRYFLPAQDVVARSQGIGIAREYLPYGAGDDELSAGVRTCQVGDVVKVKLTIMASNDLHYLVVEDWLPAGFEAVDTSLKTTSQAYEEPTLSGKERRWWWRYVNSTALRDEKAVLFATYLPRGTYEYTYLIRATTAGEFRTIPTTGYEMYFPEVWGRSDGGLFTVTP